jgi:hypothetical protein
MSSNHWSVWKNPSKPYYASNIFRKFSRLSAACERELIGFELEVLVSTNAMTEAKANGLRELAEETEY